MCKKAFAGRQCLAGVTGKDKDGIFDSHGRIAFKYGAYASVQLAVTKLSSFTLSGICALSHPGVAVNDTDKYEHHGAVLYINDAGCLKFYCYHQCNVNSQSQL